MTAYSYHPPDKLVLDAGIAAFGVCPLIMPSDLRNRAPHQRVGVWTIYRNGNPSGSPSEKKLFLKRTIATAVHEIGHMLGIRHCIAWECVMDGGNCREESDSRSLKLCPACLEKLIWNTGHDPAVRFKRLEEAANKYGFSAEDDYFKAALGVLGTFQANNFQPE